MENYVYKTVARSCDNNGVHLSYYQILTNTACECHVLVFPAFVPQGKIFCEWYDMSNRDKQSGNPFHLWYMCLFLSDLLVSGRNKWVTVGHISGWGLSTTDKVAQKDKYMF